MTDIRDLAEPGENDVTFAHRLIRDPGVASVPGSSFFETGAGPDQGAVRLPEADRDAARRRGPTLAPGLKATRLALMVPQSVGTSG